MKKGIFSAALLLAVGMTAPLAAQTVTVAKTGSPDFNTVQAAIDSFDPDPDATTANVVQITDDSVYSEIITIDVPLTLEGTGSNPPVLAVVENPDSPGANDGLLIEIPDSIGSFVDVTLRNLYVIPDQTTPPTDDGIRSAGQNLNLLVEDVVVTANDGSDAPVTTDGLTSVDVSGATLLGDDGIFVGGGDPPAGDGTQVVLRNFVTTHNQNGDGLVCSTGGSSYTVEQGSVFSFNGRLGIQGALDFSIDSPNDPVKVIGNLGFAGIWFNSAATTARVLDGVYIANNGSAGSGWGVEFQNNGTVGSTLRNAIVSGNEEQGIVVGSVGDGPTVIEDTTVSSNGSEAVSIATDAESNISVTNSIIAGNGSSDPLNIIDHSGNGTFSLTNSAVVTAGPQSLLSGAPINGTVSQSNVINDDPEFIETLDPNSASFFDVTGSAYETAATGGDPLDGGADFVVQTDSQNWNLYQ